MEAAPTKEDFIDAVTLAERAGPLIDAFDNAAVAITPHDRRVTYAALILLMTTFARSSHIDAETIMDDFRDRVVAGARAARMTKQ